MAPIPRPDSQLQEVKNLWGASACESLGNILNEFDELFMKHKADIGRCTIAKHTVELEPGAGQRQNLHQHRPCLGLFANSCAKSGLPQDRFCLRVRAFRMAADAIWLVQCVGHLPSSNSASTTEDC